MPWSDEERLERVYRRAASIRLVRRLRVVVMAMPLLALAGAVVTSAASTDDGRTLQVAGPSTTLPDVSSVPDVSTTEVPTTVTFPPHVGPTVVPSSVPTTAPTTSTTELANCGGYSPGGARPKAPEGLQITTETSKPVVRRGEEVTLTMRIRWTGSQPLTYSRSGQGHMILGTLSGMIHYSSQYDPSAEKQPPGQDTFQPGEEKAYSVRWDTSFACVVNEHREARLKTGTYVIEGFWDTDQPNWVAEPGYFELVD